MELVPITLREANTFVGELHRHHGESRGCKFALSAEKDGSRVGVCIVGRPVARGLDDGFTAEVTRLCTDGTFNACSFLYGAAARAAKELGYRKVVTYILESESGDSLRGAGWHLEATTAGGSWDCPSRPREDKHPTEPKHRYARILRSEALKRAVANDLEPIRNALRWSLAA